MKFLCKTGDIQYAISVASRAVSGQQAIPILNNILFQAEGKRCTLSATNLEFSIISHLDVEVENEGAITVPAKAIQNFAQYSTDDEILFESSEDSKLKCVSKKSRTVIAGEPASEYPVIPPIQKEMTITIPGAEFLEAIHHVVFAAARTTTRPVLSGVYFNMAKKELILVATDSYRLSEYRIPIPPGTSGEIKCIVPSKMLSEVMAIVGGARHGKEEKEEDESGKSGGVQPPAILTVSAQQIEVATGRTRVLSRLIDGTFPDYQQILPPGFKTKLAIPLSEFLTRVRRMHYFAKESNNNLSMTISSRDLLLQTQQTQAGQDEASIASDVQGEENKIALSSSYLLDFLSHISGDEVQMELTDKTHPAVFRSPGLPNLLHLIMPLRMVEET